MIPSAFVEIHFPQSLTIAQRTYTIADLEWEPHPDRSANTTYTIDQRLGTHRTFMLGDSRIAPEECHKHTGPVAWT